MNDPLLVEGDLNTDGRVDIVVVGNDGTFYLPGTNDVTHVDVLLGQGNGRFKDPIAAYNIPRSTPGPSPTSPAGSG